MNRTLTESGNGEEEEDFIDIEVISSSSSSSSSSFFYSASSPSNPREFEFQMSSNSTEKESAPSPADELFYKGNLLPLHLPPRLQMVQKLLQTSSSAPFAVPAAAAAAATASTPFDSCSNSPTCCGELNSGELFCECPSRVMKQSSSIGLRLKTYFKSLFNKPDADEGVVSKAKECLNRYMKMVRRNPFKQIHQEGYQVNENLVSGSSSHRRSFSLSIKKNSSTSTSTSSSSSSSTSSTSSSTSSNGFFELHLLKRSNSAGSEVERSVDGAIAYCKQSQKAFCPGEEVCESMSSSLVCEDQERLREF